MGVLTGLAEELGETEIRKLSRREVVELENSDYRVQSERGSLEYPLTSSRIRDNHYGSKRIWKSCEVNRHGVFKEHVRTFWGTNYCRKRDFDDICKVGMLVAENYGESQNFFGIQDWFLEELKDRASVYDFGGNRDGALADKASWLVIAELAKRKRDRAVNNESIEVYRDLTDTLQGSWRP